MANPGVGSKFVSVNLNKSYGQRPSSSGNVGGTSSRVRSTSSGGGGGGGMVLLSRSRSSIVGVQKGGPKLSVPPPLNLPSLRKEHEKFDSTNSGGGAPGAGGSGAGARPAVSSIGWTKPSLPQESVGSGNDHSVGVGSQGVEPNIVSSNGVSKNSVYMPPSARSGTMNHSAQVVSSPREYISVAVEKAVVLRGEDFPSLHATLPTVSSSGTSQRQKGVLDQKQNKKVNGDGSDDHKDTSGNSYLRPPLVMHPQNQLSRLGKVGDDRRGGNQEFGGSRMNEKLSKQDDFFPSPLPLVRLNHTSDWADDERDTRHSLPDRGRNHGYVRNDSFRDRDIDLPRGTMLPMSDGRGLHDDGFGRPPSREVLRGNSYNRELRIPSREGRDGSPWRASPVKKDGFISHDTGFDRNSAGVRPLGLNRETNKESKYSQVSLGYNARDAFNSGVMANDSRFGRRDTGYGQGSRQNGNLTAESYNGRGIEKNQYGSDLSSRYRSDSFQNNVMPKSSGKMMSVNDPILNAGREKRLSSKSQYLEDPFLKEFGSDAGFDGRDPLTGSLVGVVKRKKDMVNADFHDPIRESFEAELERVQKMQEQERQRVIEEHTRALEIARKEEEEKERIAREEEERRRSAEEEAREAAWRAEQEHLESARRAEELRVAREEEKRRVQLEEERRKEAARKKLLELEARISRRQAEGTKDNEYHGVVKDEKVLGVVKGKDVPPRAADVVDWEDGERMVERITSSASSDSSGLNRSFEVGSRPQFYREGDSVFLDRGKPVNSWRRDAFENGNNSNLIWPGQENGFRSPRREAFGAGRAISRKEFHGAPGSPARMGSRGGISEQHMVDDFSHPRGNRWNLAGEGDQYSGNSDPEFHDNFGDVGWGQGRSRGSSHAPYSERLYQNSENDGLSSFGRSRYSMRQPRVLPPPSLATMHKSTFRPQIERPGSSASQDSESSYHHAPRKNEPIMSVGYDSAYQNVLEQPSTADAVEENTVPLDKKEDKTTTSRCDSQSSLSVSSPPDSPTHLSHDDVEDSGDIPSPSAADVEEVPSSDNENVLPVAEAGHTSKMLASGSVSSGEDEEWAVENHRVLSEQEEYDEDENGYREEDEMHERDDDVHLPQEFEDLSLGEEGVSRNTNQVVLGFDEGIEVGIPSGDDFERTSTAETQKASEEPGPCDGVVGSVVQNLPSGSKSSDVSGESSEVSQKSEKELVGSSIQPASVAQISESPDHILDNVETSSGHTLSHQQLTSSANVVLPCSTVQSTTTTVSASPNQSEVPVKLQFGLFSGPSLIPSPLPAIQIGSIQMPLHLHPQVGPPPTQLHPSQPPFFQFGQLRYAAPISQGILPLGPQSMPFVQPSGPAHYNLNQNQDGVLKGQGSQDSQNQHSFVNDKIPSVNLDDRPGMPKFMDQSQEDLNRKVNVLPASVEGERKMKSESGSLVNDQGHHSSDVKKSYSSMVNNKEPQSHLHAESNNSQFISRAPGPVSGSRGKRFIYTVKNSGSRTPLLVSESPQTDSSGFRRRGRQRFPRTEFRVRENVDKRQREGLLSPNYPGPRERSNFSGRVPGNFVQNSSQRDAHVSKQHKMVGSERLSSDSMHADSESKMENQVGKEVQTKKLISSLNISPSGQGSSKRIDSEEDVDAPLQSGIVRVFKQPGIEAPSDEDDFIQVRSKRQMLNDRREQREKEIKARSRAAKAPKKRRPVTQNNTVSASLNKNSTSFGGDTSSIIHRKPVGSNGKVLVKVQGSTGFTSTVVSSPLAPIGTPAGNSDAHADSRSRSIKSPQTGPTPVIPNGGTNLVPGLSFEKNMGLDNVQTTLGPWGNARTSQQVMALTQTQLDEAMKPRFDTHVAAIGDHTMNKQSSSITTQDKSFSSAASPLNSLLAGEKIQFGAVTSPTILPSTSLVVSSGIGPPIDHSLSAVDSDCTLFFKKDKHQDESCVDLEDPEAEAEAAASAVAVAAISSDDIVGSGCSVSVADTTSFGGAEKEVLTSEGEASNRQSASQSRGEESLSVALPADLSVEMPLWPSIPSPQNSSSQMLSHFSGGLPSHIPCYEMNPMLAGRVFAFGSHDESAGTQPQSQKSCASGPAPLGAWQQCHSGVDSFYGPPTGFTGPFISPTGGIPGVQGPPQMVFYNHFTPVGQFGQVGLSFMGTTYIPSGKQPDWKHNPASSAMGIGEGDISNANMASAQRNPPSMPAPIQHLAPGSPLMPPLAMFDMSPFQSSNEVPHPTCWSHVPSSTLHSVPPSMPMQQQSENAPPSQFNHGSPLDQSTANRFHVPCSTSSESGRNYPVTTQANVSQFPDELGLVDPASTTSTRVSASRPSYSSTIINGKTQSAATKSLSRSTVANAGESSGSVPNTSNNNSSQNTGFAPKSQSQQPQTSTQQYLHSPGYSDQRSAGVHHKTGSGGEWSRRMGFQGRNQSSGTDKKNASSKVKQIYVAKPATSRASAAM